MSHTADARGYYDYRILGLDPDQPRGHKFQSKIPDLDVQPDLWLTECPYRFPDSGRIDIVKASEAPPENAVRGGDNFRVEF